MLANARSIMLHIRGHYARHGGRNMHQKGAVGGRPSVRHTQELPETNTIPQDPIEGIQKKILEAWAFMAPEVINEGVGDEEADANKTKNIVQGAADFNKLKVVEHGLEVSTVLDGPSGVESPMAET